MQKLAERIIFNRQDNLLDKFSIKTIPKVEKYCDGPLLENSE
jgi:hypothetical protein